jgi:hypothetical protein
MVSATVIVCNCKSHFTVFMKKHQRETHLGFTILSLSNLLTNTYNQEPYRFLVIGARKTLYFCHHGSLFKNFCYIY